MKGLSVIEEENDLLVNFSSFKFFLASFGSSIIVKQVRLSLEKESIKCDWKIRWSIFAFFMVLFAISFIYKHEVNLEQNDYWISLIFTILAAPILFFLNFKFVKYKIDSIIKTA